MDNFESCLAPEERGLRIFLVRLELAGNEQPAFLPWHFCPRADLRAMSHSKPPRAFHYHLDCQDIIYRAREPWEIGSEGKYSWPWGSHILSRSGHLGQDDESDILCEVRWRSSSPPRPYLASRGQKHGRTSDGKRATYWEWEYSMYYRSGHLRRRETGRRRNYVIRLWDIR